MADHSVGPRDEFHESEASEASVFCFNNASPEIYFAMPTSFWVPESHYGGVKSSTGEKELFSVSPFASEGKTDEVMEFTIAERTVKFVCYISS